jgi:endonuclease-3 related protein
VNYKELHKILYSKYGDLRWWPAETIDQIIIGAILTQNTSWKNVEFAMKNLKTENLDTVEKLGYADLDKIKECVRPAGFFNQKSLYLKGVCKSISDYGGLDALKNLPDSSLTDFLINLKGIGKETMQDIMLYAFNRPIFVVDKYTERLFSRIGLIQKGMKNAYEIGVTIEKGLPIYDLKNFHGEVIEISKSICQSKPLCEKCFLKDSCSYAKDLTDP